MKVQIDLKLAIDIVEKLAEIRSVIGEDIITLNDLSDRLKQSICGNQSVLIGDTKYPNKLRLEQNEPYHLSMRIDLKTGMSIYSNHENARRRINYSFNKNNDTMDLLVNIGPME